MRSSCPCRAIRRSNNPHAPSWPCQALRVAAARVRRPRAPPFIDPPGYARHRPETTLLYQLVEQHYPAFRDLRAAADRPLPDYVQQEFDAYLNCGRLEEGFLRVRCEHCHAEKLVAFSCKKRGFCPSYGAMILSLPPQRAQQSISMPNTRFRRRAQFIAT